MNTEIEKQLQSILISGTSSTGKDEIEKFTVSNPVFNKGKLPLVVIKPGNSSELKALIEQANTSDMNLTIASSTGDHLKGGFANENENCMIDLSCWNRIKWINRRNRVCMIEPGVTYKALLEALARQGMTISMPLAPRDGKSVLAAVTDREPGTWPNKQWDISDPVACTEFIFGNGDVFRTGAAGGPGTIEQQRAAGGAQKGPLGPSQADFHRVIQGSQGTMGIVTWISMRTELKPSIEEPYVIGTDNLSNLVPYVYGVQRPWLGEHSFILNRTALSMLMSHRNPDNFSNLRATLPAYVCLQNIAGFERFPEERVTYQKNDIRKIAKENRLNLETDIGDVSAAELLSTATRTCGEVDFRNRLKGNCLSVFFLTTLDRSEELVGKIIGFSKTENIMEDEIGIYIQPVVQNHACHMEIMVPFNGDDAEEVTRIKNYESNIVKMLLSENVFFSRPYGTAGDLVFERNPLNTEMMKKVKDIFDPNRVLGRGKWHL